MKRPKFVDGVSGSKQKMTYNQARLEDVYRSMNMTATYYPKAMLSTSFNNRKGDKKTVTSANRNNSKRTPQLGSSSKLKSSATSKSLNERNLKSSENLNEEKNLVTEPLEPVDKAEKNGPQDEDTNKEKMKLEDLQTNNQIANYIAQN